MSVESRKVSAAGLKNHQIARLVSDVTKSLRNHVPTYLPPLPDSLRFILSEAIVKSLTEQGLKIDP